MSQPKEITLDMLLASRDQRHQTQMQLLSQHPDKTLVCLTVIMPGRVKRNAQSLLVAKAATDALRQAFIPSSVEYAAVVTPPTSLLERDLPTGYEAYLLTPLPPAEAKRIVCDIEESHPLGRLFDLDVIDHQGVPLSRESIGRQPRRCLLCDHDARYCMRNHTHTPAELHQRIADLIAAYSHSAASQPT